MWFSAKTTDKDKIIEDKNHQIKILNELIVLNSQQSISQKNMIDELKKKIEFEKRINEELFKKYNKIQDELSLSKKDINLWKFKYENLEQMYNKMRREKDAVKLTEKVDIENSATKSSDNSKLSPHRRSNSLTSSKFPKGINVKQIIDGIQSSTLPFQNKLADQENDNLTPRIIIHKTPDASNQNSNSKDQKSCSNFFLDVAEELEKGVISKEISMLSVSENNCSKESNEDSNDMGRVSKFKKNHLKVITNLVEESDFSERKNHERKATQQYLEDLSTSVVALKYSSVLSPLHPSFSYDKLGHTFRKSSFLNAKKDVGTPINFVPLNELGKKPDFSANLRKIEEETHRQNITERKDFVNQEDNKNTSSKNLFEEFVVMGIDKEEFKNNNSLNEGFDPAKILYIFDSSKNKSVDCPRRRIISDFAFPYGVPFKKISIKNSFASINEIVFSKNPNDNFRRPFIFTLRSDEFYEKQHQNDPLLNILNPDRILYCICLVKKDFVETTTETHIHYKENRKYRQFFATRQIYCFVSYFPFFKLFIDLLEDIINKLKFMKLELYTQKKSEEHEILNQIDNSIVKKIFGSEINDFLSKLQIANLPGFGKFFEIEGLVTDKIKYQMPLAETAEFEEFKWGAALSFSNLSVTDLFFIYSALLLEKKIIFISKDISLLTATIQTFCALIRPFSWPHPLIYNLPETLFPLLDSPIPFIFGINQSCSFLFQHNLKQSDDSNILFIDLDDSKLIYSQPKIIKIKKFQEFFREIEEKIRENYKYFNPNPTQFLVSNTNERKIEKTKNQLIYSPTEEDETRCKIIIDEIRKNLYGFCLKNLPLNPIFNNNFEDGNPTLDFSKLIEKMFEGLENQTQITFIKRLNKSQLFAFWLEKHYQLF